MTALPRRFMGVLCCILTLSAQIMFPGCSPQAADPGAAFRLSAGSLQPGEFLTVTHEAIEQGQELTVSFTGPDGYDVTIEAVAAEDGQIQVAAPPFVDAATGVMTRGEVTLTIDGLGKPEELVLEAPDEVPGTAPGAIYQTFLEELIVVYEQAFTDLAAAAGEAGSDLDVAATSAALQTQIDQLQADLQSFQASATITVQDASGQDVTLTAEQLSELDKLLFSTLQGLAQTQDRAGSSSRRQIAQSGGSAGQPGGSVDDGTPLGSVRQWFHDLTTTVPAQARGGSLLLGYSSMAASLVGFAEGATLLTVGAYAGVAIAALGLAYNLSTGIAVKGVAIATGQKDRVKFDAAQTTLEGLKDIALSVPGGRPIQQAADIANTANDMAKDYEALTCPNPSRQLDPDAVDFCSSASSSGGDPPASAAGVNGCWQMRVISDTGLELSDVQILVISGQDLQSLWSIDGLAAVEVVRFTRPNAGVFGEAISAVRQSIGFNTGDTVFSLSYDMTIQEETDGVFREGGETETDLTGATFGTDASGRRTFEGDYDQTAVFYLYDEDGYLEDTETIRVTGRAVATETACPDAALPEFMSQEELLSAAQDF